MALIICYPSFLFLFPAAVKCHFCIHNSIYFTFCRRHCRISNSLCHGQEWACVTVFRRTDLLHQICRLRPSWWPRTRPPNRKHGPVSGFLWHSLWRFWQNWGNRLRSKAPTCFYLQLCKFRLSNTSLHAPMCVHVCLFLVFAHDCLSESHETSIF